jgi:beta-lactamase regulating signal transducer with metallopeptidase domain
VDALLHLGLSNALTAAALAVPVALLARVGRRPALTHALWLLVLLKLVTPPLLSVPLPWSDPLAAAPQTAAAPAPPAPELAPPPARFDQAPADAEPLPGEALPALPGFLPAAEEPPATRPAEPAGRWDWGAVLVAVWLTGSALWWGIACVRVARFRRLLRHATPAPPEVQERARELARRLGLRRCPQVWLVPARVSPLLWALGWAPRVLLPADLWAALPPDQRDTLLAHELAHLRRRDHWVRRLELLALGLFWWHPVVWWARRELAEAEEQCCDAWVVWALPESGPAYAAALVETLAFLSQARRPVPVAASGAGRFETLKRRLTMILQRPSPRTLSGAGLLAVVALGGLLLPLLPTWADQQPAAARAEAAPALPATDNRAADLPAAAGTPAAESTSAVKAPPASGGAARKPVALPPASGAANASPAGAEGAPPANLPGAESAEKLRDEVELLEAQLAVKRAHLQVAKTVLEQAAQKVARATAQFEKGVLGAGTVAQARGAMEQAKGDLLVHEAELRVAQVRLEQARRRLAALQARPGKAAEAPPPGWADQLFEARQADVRLLRGEKALVLFRLSNRTGKAAHIRAVRVSSGAVTAVASRTDLPPGEKGEIRATVDGARFAGNKVILITVAFDKPHPAEVTLQVRAVTTGPDAGKKGAGPGKGQDDREQLRELEKKLDLLRKELDSLRKRLPPEDPNARPKTGAANSGPAAEALYRQAEDLFREGKYAEVAVRLRETLVRSPQNAKALAARDLLGECYRKLAEQGGAQVKGDPGLHYKSVRWENLGKARRVYDELAEDLEKRLIVRGLSPAADPLYRKAELAAADCLVQLPNELSEAVRRFAKLAERYRGRVEGLIACQRLLACPLLAGGDVSLAREALQKARVALQAAREDVGRIPEEQFRGPNMATREQWRVWLEKMSRELEKIPAAPPPAPGGSGV